MATLNASHALVKSSPRSPCKIDFGVVGGITILGFRLASYRSSRSTPGNQNLRLCRYLQHVGCDMRLRHIALCRGATRDVTLLASSVSPFA